MKCFGLVFWFYFEYKIVLCHRKHVITKGYEFYHTKRVGSICGEKRYKNVLVLKNYVCSFAANVEDNIDKTREKAVKAFSSLDHRKTDLLNHVKFWRKACLRSLLFGTELFTNEC